MRGKDGREQSSGGDRWWGIQREGGSAGKKTQRVKKQGRLRNRNQRWRREKERDGQ